MKYLIKNQLLLIVLGLGMITFFSQCKDDDVEPENILAVNGNGHSHFNNNALQIQINNLPNQPLSAAEEAGLLFMREEEKLAHDVYVQLFSTWDTQIFNNIAAAEQTHTAAIKVLIDKYSLTDPVGNNAVGVFVDTTLQALHDNLLAEGVQSLIQGLKVGATIEEVDILDLENELTNVVDNDDIKLVYQNLQKGSRNHLRAFVKKLEMNGVTYIPQFLSPTVYQAIIDGEMETGGS